ncbi:MAG: hypothetical protein IPN60_09290 [Saprospiraceae bacterium]|nr:hypothetical protein [Candidatus Opimibacter skivensis]
MPVYKYIRKKKWFSYIGPGNPGDFVQAIYRGTDEDDVEDPLLGPNGGVPGNTYIVGLLYKASAVVAPCPDFCNGGEAIRISKADRDIMNAFQKTSELMEKQFNKERRQYLRNVSSDKPVVTRKMSKTGQKSKPKTKAKGKG